MWGAVERGGAVECVWGGLLKLTPTARNTKFYYTIMLLVYEALKSNSTLLTT
jgi:hypothetical protein